MSGEPLIISPLVSENATLKSELVDAFELAQIKAPFSDWCRERVVEGKALKGTPPCSRQRWIQRKPVSKLAIW